MRAVIKNKIATFYPQGFIDANNVVNLIQEDEIAHIIKMGVDAVLISLEKVVFFNKKGIEAIIDILERIRKTLSGVVVGFCDYNERKYRTILKMVENEMTFSLFRDIEVAKLFIGNIDFKENNSILLYTDEQSQQSSMALILHERGYTPIIAKSLEDFQLRKSDKSKFLNSVNLTHLGSFSKKVAAIKRENVIVYKLNGFLDTTILEQFDLEYHNSCINIGFKLFLFDASDVLSMNAHAISFFMKLSHTAMESGANIFIAGFDIATISLKLKKDLEEAGILFFASVNEFFENKNIIKELESSGANSKKNAKKIDKELILQLSVVVDIVISSINMLTNVEIKKELVEIRNFQIDSKIRLTSAALGLFGDIEGVIFVAFPKTIALKACNILLGSTNSPSDEEILIATAELLNIIGNKLKAHFYDKNVRVITTAPIAFRNINEGISIISDKKGAQVNFSFDNKDKFYFFFTK